MRVRTYLRALRTSTGLSITDVCVRTGIARGEISMYERGHSIPGGAHTAAMAAVYGDPEGWYPRMVLAVLPPDLPACPGCGDELDPDASRRRRYHNDRCRSEARRTGRKNTAAPV